MYTNPCSEVSISDMFPEDNLVKDLEGVDVGIELISKVIEQASDLVEHRISMYLPGYKELTFDEVKAWLEVHYTFSADLQDGEVEAALAIVPVLSYKSHAATLKCMNGCIKIIRDLYIRDYYPSGPIKAFNSYETYARKLHPILQPLVALKPVADV